MKKGLIASLVTRTGSRRNFARTAPKFSSLRTEPLESRELLSATDVVFAASALAQDAVVAQNYSEQGAIDLSDVELSASNAVSSTTWTVTSPVDDASVAGTLRNALENADDGDTIVFDSALQGATIAIGSRLEVSKSITIDASNLLDATTSAPGLTISGQGTTSILYLNGNYDVEIDGIAFTNGNAASTNSSDGGAITSIGATLSLNSCAISDSVSVKDGGGAYLEGGKATFTDCVITNNTASKTYGGGVYANGGEATFVNCSLTNNTANFGGSAIASNYATLSFDGCSISDNAGYTGGGLNISFGSATLTDCVLTNNTVQYYGGAVYNHTAAVSLDNCLISDNKAQYYGGAAYANYGKTKLVNCTVTNNTATRGGGGVYLNLNSEADSFSSYNSIIAGNAASSGAADVDGGASFAPYAKAYNTLSSYSNWADGANNVAYDSSKPLFKNAATKDYSLAIGSQAIDKGDNQRITEGTEFDLAGNPRIDGAFVDLGAYEFQKIKLDAPENPNETDRAETTITVAWDAVQDASGYQLAWKKATDSDYTFVGNIGATTTSYTIANLDTGVIYEWKVQAVGDGISYIDSDYTAPRSVKTLRKLDAPGSLSETAKTETTITVSWGSVANASGYQLAWKDATASDYTLVDNIAAATTSYTIDGLDNAATYEWKVQAIGDDVDFLDSDYSETRTSKPRQGLTAPGSLSETAKTETTITVAWDSVANASGYRVAWKNATDSDYTFVDNIAATTYTIDGLDNAATYEWKVQAIGDGIDYADSDYSQTRTVKPRQVLDAPTISLGAVEATTIAVSWTAVDAASSYRVTLQPVGGVSVDYDVDASATSYTIAVAPTTTYAVKVAAVGDGFDYSDSEYSNSVTAVTPEERLTVVTTENDVVDEFDGVVSLREALVYAESGATITFDSSLQGKTIKLALGELAPSKSITIDASSLLDATASASGLTISGQGTSRILSVGGDVSVAVSGITFANGYTDGDGGAVLASSGSTSLVNCVLTSNTGVNGGAVYAGSQAVFTAAGCLVVGNAATNGGGLELNGSAELSNCTIVGNSADNGGGVDLAGAAVLNVYNTIILDNVASIDGDDVYFAGSEAVANARNTLSNFKDWTSGERNPNYNESKPLFTDAESGDYSLAYNTQVLDKGNNNYVSTDVDVAGNPRISDKTVDIGAYEYQKIVLATPTPSITSKTTSSIKVVWDAVPDAVGYRFIWKNRLDSAFSVYTVDASTTEYEFTELNEGIYYLKIQALADKIGYADSEYTALQIYQTQITLSAPTLSAPYPTAQTNAKAKTETSITAAWKAVPHATGYVFQWKNETDSDFNVVQLGASTTSYKFSDLDNAATYEWKVQALGDAVDYLDSPDTELQIDQPRQKLETPIPYAKTKTETSITIAWDANPNATGYRFIWKNRTDAAFKVFTVDAETTEYEFPNLDSDGIYYWKVQALGDQIDYANSEYTALEIDKPQKSLAAPVATAASASTAYATVKWTYVPNAVGYGVSYKPVSASEWSAEINAGTNLRYVIEGFESGVEYNVRVRALGDKIDYANSDYSEVVVFKKLETPTPSATKTESTITVAWDTVLGATGYRFIWKNRLDPAYEVHTVDASTTSCEFTSLENNGIYYWKVQALGDNVSILNSEYCALQTVKLIKAPDPEVTFSIEAGSNVENQTLEIYAPKGCVVYYTTDGSDPVVSPENLYSEPIALSANASRFAADSNLINVGNAKIYDNNSLPKAVTVKAVAVAPNGAASPIETKTYFFQERESVAVISISTDYDNLLDYDTGIMVKGAYYDDWANTSEGAYIIAHKQWWNCQGNYTQKGKDWERPATVEIFDGENYVVENCGIRLRGGTSRMYSQKPFNIYFRKDYGAKTLDYALFEDAVSIDGNVLSAYKDFMLRNGGNDTEYLKFHDALIQSLVKDLNFTTQASRPAILYLNGEYMGVYVMQEKYSDRFFADHYLVDKDNVVVIEEGAVDEGKDADIALYEELQSYANMDMTDPEVYNAFRNVADVESMIDYYATEIYIANFDWHPTKNTRLWRVKTPENDSFGDGRWRWILYDTEYSSSLYKRTETAYNYDSFTAALEADSLFASVIRNADFYQAFAEKIESLAVNNFSSANVNSALASFSDAYRPYMSDYYKRFGDTSSAWNSNINGIRNFFANRARYILSFVENYQP